MKIDIDHHANPAWIHDKVHLVLIPVCEAHNVTVLSVQKCRSRSKGLHLFAHITPSVSARLANKLQFLVGDDALRVRLNGLRITAGFDEFNKLWNYPGRRMRTIYRRSRFGPEHEKKRRGDQQK